MQILNLDIERLNHAAFKIKGTQTLYIDPFHIKDNLEPADIILVSHEHYDHCSPEDIKKIANENTILVTVADNLSKLHNLKLKEVLLVEPGKTVMIGSAKIEAVPAYNTNKHFHPKDNCWVGFIVDMDGNRVYYGGDTDFIPEMASFKTDIALLPVSGTYVMTAEEAVQAVASIKPKIAIPMHYGDIIGTEADAIKFKELVKGCEVRIL
ncbi:MAG TPA: MBL fold metallo-hydrolase [Candidatus Nanoarchaeia archaeon]|nr:MBL fold metallo-hydrolase [Candidatus Nanoarchaeia archaeon]